MLMDELPQVFSALMSSELTVIDQQKVTGGCISESFQVLTEDLEGHQQHWFAKTNRPSFLENFQARFRTLLRAFRRF